MPLFTTCCEGHHWRHGEGVLILGAGVHGAAIARDLVAQGIPVYLAERYDLAYGATSKSSRLIHGGLRYLEYGDIKLVRESLHERQWMQQHAASYIRPLRFYIPVRTRWGGWWRSVAGFLGLARVPWLEPVWTVNRGAARGYWPVRLGLKLYDFLAGHSGLPSSHPVSFDHPDCPKFANHRYKFCLAYSDCQWVFPERLVMALLHDAVNTSLQSKVPLAIHTYVDVTVETSGEVSVVSHSTFPWRRPCISEQQVKFSWKPRVIINATGAWGDLTRGRLGIAKPQLFRGTRGSHLVTYHPGLKAALKGGAVYAEAEDGRLIFVLPFLDAVLIGTTDLPDSDDPAISTTTDEEVEYLIDLVRSVFDIQLAQHDIELRYAGIRPLPLTQATGLPQAVTRDHHTVWEYVHGVPLITLVGGKLTTWRCLAQQVSDQVLKRYPAARQCDTLELPIWGGDALATPVSTEQSGKSQDHGDYLRHLFGERTDEIVGHFQDEQPFMGQPFIPRQVVSWVLHHEWVTTLADLVERRLMLVFASRLTREDLYRLAEEMVKVGLLAPSDVDAEVTSCCQRLSQFYARQFQPAGAS